MVKVLSPFPFDKPHFWSLLKLEILGKYADTVAKIIGSRTPITFVDLMAGEGSYESGDLGSAGTLAQIAAANQAAGRPIQLRAIEANDSAFERLKANTSAAGDFTKVEHAKWEEKVETLLADLQRQFVFFFVDPMGVREIPWTALKPLVERQNTELLINFNSTVAARLGGISAGTSPHANASRRTLVSVLGGDYWQDGLGPARAEGGTHHHFASVYMRFICQQGHYAACSVPIAERGIAGRPKYHLIFASRNGKAFEVMNYILHSQRERLRKESTLANELPLFAEQLATTYDTDRESQLVGELARSLAVDPMLRNAISVQDLFRKGLMSRFAAFKAAHYRRAATTLLEDGVIEVIGNEKRHSGYLQTSVRVRLRQGP
jgi:three-Cys-motif partner protein